MRAAALDARLAGRARRAREMARLRAPAAPRALRRGDRPAGPDQVGADRPPGARRRSYGLANRTDGASHEAPARWLVDARDPGRAAQPCARPLARARRARRSARASTSPPSFGLRRARRRRRRGRARVVLRPRHLARRQALARGELDRARPAPRRAGLARSRCRRRAPRSRRAPQRIAAALGGAARGLAGDGPRRARRPPGRDATARSASTAARATSPSRSTCRTCRSTTSRPRGAPGRRRATAHRHQVVGRRRSRRRRSTRCGRPGSRCRAPPAASPARAGAVSALRRRWRARPTRCCCAWSRRSTCCACAGAAAREPLYRQRDRRALRLLSPSAAAPGAVWVHAVSLGETRAAGAADRRACARRGPALRILLTHGTATGRAAGAGAAARGRRAGLAAVRHARRRCAASCATSHPAAGVLMETEIWPNLLAAARRAACRCCSPTRA